MLKHMLIWLSSLLVLLFITACGGGGGEEVKEKSTSTQPSNSAYTKATVKISLTGTLPAGSSIAGVGFTLTFPPDISPLIANGTVAPGVVTLTGAFTGSIQPEPIYTPSATTAASGKLFITVASQGPTGVTELGELASIDLQLGIGGVPTVNNFIVSADNIIDLAGRPITTVSAVVADVTLQPQ